MKIRIIHHCRIISFKHESIHNFKDIFRRLILLLIRNIVIVIFTEFIHGYHRLHRKLQLRSQTRCKDPLLSDSHGYRYTCVGLRHKVPVPMYFVFK